MNVCYAAGPDCDGPLQRHHVVKRQRIRAAWKSLMAAKRRGGPNPWSITKAIEDPRNLVWTCLRHHTEETEMPPPEGFWAFVAEYNLEAALPRYLSCGAAATSSQGNGQGTVVSRRRSPREEAA
jgi:hypothetical protein